MKNGTAFFHETGIQTDRIGFLGQYIATCTQAFIDSADGMAIGLGALKPEFRDRENLERIISCVPRPFYVYFYRNDKWIPESNQNDETRQRILMIAADAGAAMKDRTAACEDSFFRRNKNEKSTICTCSMYRHFCRSAESGDERQFQDGNHGLCTAA